MGVIAACIAIFVLALLLLKLYLIMIKGVFQSKRSMEGKTVIVTGANTGIGLETARDLARRKARVILACRNLARGEEALRDIIKSTGNENVVLRLVDLSSMSSVRKFAEEINNTERRLDVLIHNAAIIPPPGKHITAEGLELQFATNHFGPFLLTHLLLDLMKRSAPSRIVVVSSSGHKFVRLNLGKLYRNEYVGGNPLSIYLKTKLANLLFACELHERLLGTGVTVNSAHPGIVDTTLMFGRTSMVRFFFSPLFYFIVRTSVQGAQTIIHLAVSEEVEGMSGKYFDNCRESQLRFSAEERKLAAELWKISEKLTKIC